MKIYTKFRDFCNANQGIFALLALAIMIIGIIPKNFIDLSFTNSFLQKIGLVITYDVKIPVYALLIVILIWIIYYSRIRLKYKTKTGLDRSYDFLVGTWKNEWTSGSQNRSEICEITSDGKYIVNNIHYFNITDLKIDASTGQITFAKTSVRPNDTRVLINDLIITNNSSLEGKENDIKISYTKIK